jgi:hypothetical protein
LLVSKYLQNFPRNQNLNNPALRILLMCMCSALALSSLILCLSLTGFGFSQIHSNMVWMTKHSCVTLFKICWLGASLKVIFYVFVNLCNQMDHCSFRACRGKPRRNLCSRPPQYVHSCLLLLPHYLAKHSIYYSGY